MNRRLKIVIPVVAGFVALGAGLGALVMENDRAAAAASANETPGEVVQSKVESAQAAQPDISPSLKADLENNALQVTAARVAKLLGITSDDLKTELASGKTLADIAKEHSVSQDQLVQTVLAPVNDELSTLVNYGYLTNDQETALFQGLQQKVDVLVNMNLQDVMSSGALNKAIEGFMGQPTTTPPVVQSN